MIKKSTTFSLAVILSLSGPISPQAADWPMWGGTPQRNMVSKHENGLPASFNPGTLKEEITDLATTQNVKWVARLGSQSYGNVTVANGRIFLGTNNEAPYDQRLKGDRSLVLCLDEKTGDFLWQLSIPKLGAGKVSDWEYLGVCSSPTVDGERVYILSNRCEVICLDVQGLANGNDGDFQNEGAYMAGGKGAPVELTGTEADILWIYDMREELGIFPHNITSSSALIVGDVVYVTTSNGVDWSHINIPSPQAPALVSLDKKTGELLGEEASGIGTRLMHCSWSSPTFGNIDGKDVLIYGAGDGFTYGFDPQPIEDDEGFAVFTELWRFDCNNPTYRQKDGKKVKYATYDGPSEVIGTPVFYKNRVYVSTGQDPEHGDGVGRLSCYDLRGASGDITQSKRLWVYDGMHRSISTVSIHEGLVYAADYSGKLHCLDAETGEVQWVHDLGSHIWSSTLVADGKVYLGTEEGQLVVFQTGREKKLLGTTQLDAPIYSTTVAANGVLYIACQNRLYAVAQTEK